MSRRERERYVRSRELRVVLTQLQRDIASMSGMDWNGRAAVVRAAYDALRQAIPIDPDGPIRGEASAVFRVALEQVYPPGMADALWHFEPGHSQHTEWALDFLEANPQFHRAGYLRTKLLRRVGRGELTAEERQRLHAVVLRALDEGRTEFRAYCRAARRIDSAELRADVAERLTGARADEAVVRRAQWLLNVLNS